MEGTEKEECSHGRRGEDGIGKIADGEASIRIEE
jgi:hypothetical protein